MSKHSALPWKVVKDDDAMTVDIGISDYDPGDDDYRGMVAWITRTNQIPEDEAFANAAFIVKAVNSYDGLIAALEVIAEKNYDGGVGSATKIAQATLDAVKESE